jgi:hypothetical protein
MMSLRSWANDGIGIPQKEMDARTAITALIALYSASHPRPGILPGRGFYTWTRQLMQRIWLMRPDPCDDGNVMPNAR